MTIELPPLLITDGLRDDAGNWNATSYWRDSVEQREHIFTAALEDAQRQLAEAQARIAELDAALSSVRRRLECAQIHMASDIAKIVDAARGKQ